MSAPTKAIEIHGPEVERRLLEGQKIVCIAKDLGICIATVSHIAERRGVFLKWITREEYANIKRNRLCQPEPLTIQS
jgi:hypothetical protein